MTTTPRIFVTSILNDVRRKFDPMDFQGGSITSILGSADVNLKEASIKIDEAHLEITNILGNVYIYPAEDWNIQLEIVEFAGKAKDRRNVNEKKKVSKKILRITGVTFFGDVYIR